MRILSAATAAIVAAGLLVSAPAYAKGMKTMKMDNGKTLHYQMMKIHGKMMVVIPADEFEDVFHRGLTK